MGNVEDRVKEPKEEMDKVQTSLQSDPLNKDIIQEERKAISDYVC